MFQKTKMKKDLQKKLKIKKGKAMIFITFLAAEIRLNKRIGFENLF